MILHFCRIMGRGELGLARSQATFFFFFLSVLLFEGYQLRYQEYSTIALSKHIKSTNKIPFSETVLASVLLLQVDDPAVLGSDGSNLAR